MKLNQNSLTKNKGEKTIDENNSNNNSKYNQVIDKISDNLGVLNPEETKDYSKITSKVVVEDKANNSTINDNEEIFKNYKSDFDGIDNKILDKEITQNVEKIEKKENIKKGITKKENIKTKPKYTKQIIGVIIALLIVFLPTYYFKDEILNYFSPKNNIINDNNNIDDKEILTNTGELITKTGSNILNEQEIKEIINHIENTDNTYTKEQIDKLIKEKIIEIYLKKQIKNLY